MNAFDNMALPLKNAKMDKADIKDYVYGVARRLDIEYLLNRRPKHMSWGQRQRVSLGRAICRRPGVMLLDEPLSGADEELRVELRDTIKALHEEYGFTCVYVTHDMKDALVLADRILTMKSGKIVEDQTRDEFVKKQEEKEEKQNLYLGGSVRFDASGKMIFDGGGKRNETVLSETGRAGQGNPRNAATAKKGFARLWEIFTVEYKSLCILSLVFFFVLYPGGNHPGRHGGHGADFGLYGGRRAPLPSGTIF